MTEPDIEQARRLAVIRDIANTAVKELTEHQRELEAPPVSEPAVLSR